MPLVIALIAVSIALIMIGIIVKNILWLTLVGAVLLVLSFVIFAVGERAS